MILAPTQPPVPAPTPGAALTHRLRPFVQFPALFAQVTVEQARHDADIRRRARGLRTHTSFVALQRKARR